MTVPLDRSYLYAPTLNDRILAKVFDRGVDAIVLDLEDSIPVKDKARARVALRAFLAPLTTAPARLLVRVNRDGEGWNDDDLQAAVDPAVSAISLPKAESPAAVAKVAARVEDLETSAGIAPGQVRLHLLIESATGAQAIDSLSGVDRVERFGLGAADLAADLGILGMPDPAAFDVVRARMVLASRAAGLGAPVDAVHTDLGDLDGLRAAAHRARGFGFFGKSAVHPAQVAVINDVFTPTASELAWATGVLASAADDDGGAFALAGQLIDAPIVARARALVALANPSHRQGDL
ncbi:MAG: citrate lyase subunit beta/citryl-CoA lyase [Glaciecola sp.]|jgi:citrate lyase subunit beta/citryl-CoA lyase